MKTPGTTEGQHTAPRETRDAAKEIDRLIESMAVQQIISDMTTTNRVISAAKASMKQ